MAEVVSPVSQHFSYPAWLEQKRIPDEKCALAYAETTPQFRGAIKTGIALADFYFSPHAESSELLRSDKRLGYYSKKRRYPAEWVMLVFDGTSDAPAKICASAILPALAGVKNIFSVFIGTEPSFLALTTLELCGVDETFLLTRDDFGNLLEQLLPIEFSGRVIRHGESEPGIVASQFQTYSCRNKGAALLLNEKSFDLGQIESLYGDITEDAGYPYYDCIFSAENSRLPRGRLVITPGCEGFWLHDNLAADFFYINELVCGEFGGDNHAMP